jgi:sterol 3beta-glucosyltransferase
MLSNPIKRKIQHKQLESLKPFRIPVSHADGLTISFHGGEEPLKLVFSNSRGRDEALRRIGKLLEVDIRPSTPSTSSSISGGSDIPFTASPPSTPPSSTASHESTPKHHHQRSPTSIIAPLARSIAASVAISVPPSLQIQMPKAINMPRPRVGGHRSVSSNLMLGDIPPRHFMCLTIGSRGDVQPYIALGKGLREKGHRVTIVTHEEYREWIVGFGIEHRAAGGDPGALMKLSVENKMFSPEFFKESLSNVSPETALDYKKTYHPH